MNETALMYWLASGAEMTARGISSLLCEYSLEELWQMPADSFASLPYLPGKAAPVLLRRRDEGLILSEIKELKGKGIWLISIGGPHYPESLKQIDDPPVLLYGMGRLPSEDLPRIAVIGARKSTSYGLACAKKITRGLASSGFVVVSGLARGIDAQAHKTAIDTAISEYGEENATFATIAVLGCGVDICYPYENMVEYRRVLRYGCVLSEYPPGTKPTPYAFPRRNRIITGLSLGVIVVEAAEKSGTSKTVEVALSQGREVFVVPGSVFSAYSIGTNNLIKDGATPITSYLDVLYALRRELGSSFTALAAANESYADEHNIGHKPGLCNEERLILKHLSETPADTGYLAAITGLAAQDIMFFLSKMEIAGIVKSVSSGYLQT